MVVSSKLTGRALGADALLEELVPLGLDVLDELAFDLLGFVRSERFTGFLEK